LDAPVDQSGGADVGAMKERAWNLRGDLLA
jgi:hypothetical protein